MAKLSPLHCPNCRKEIKGLRARGNCPECGVLLSARYLAVDEHDNWVVTPADKDQQREIVTNPEVTLIYSIPWDES